MGSSINPCTKGLWLWKQTMKNKNDEECLVIDCEGFGGIDESNNHDNKIFIFALLLSTYFIYNS